jgi:hypothetical protein
MARITATAGGVADSAVASVQQQPIRLVVTPAADTINAIGDSAVFTASVQDRNDFVVPGMPITWAYNTAVLSMPAPGVFVSRAPGTVSVLVNGAGFERQVTVVSRQVPATVQLRSGDTLIVGARVPLPLTAVRDSNGVDIPPASRPAAAATATGAVSVHADSVQADAAGTGSVTVTVGPADATTQYQVIAFDSVAASSHHACGRTTTGAMYCWGSGFNVAGAPVGRPRRMSVPGPVLAITPDCALVHGGTVYCGLVGAPVPWMGVPPFVALSEGCGLTAGGEAWCRDPDGVLRPVTGYTFKQIAQRYINNTHPPVERCGVQLDGSVLCWAPGGTPAPLAGGHAFREIALGEWLSCGITTDGRLLCWGDMYGGSTPVLVSASLGLVSLNVGYANGCGLRADGALFCWGNQSTDWAQYTPGPPTAPAPKWPALRFTDYSVGYPVQTSLNLQTALECGAAGGALWCDGGEQRGSATGRTGGGTGGRVISPM